MASAAITSLPGQQSPVAGEIEQQSNNIPQAVSASTSTSANWHTSSGSIGPFFGVISVLAVLAILSCILGRVCSRRTGGGDQSSLEMISIKHRGCFGRMKRKNRWCRSGGDVEVGAKVMDVAQDQKQDCKDKDGEVGLQPPQA